MPQITKKRELLKDFVSKHNKKSPTKYKSPPHFGSMNKGIFIGKQSAVQQSIEMCDLVRKSQKQNGTYK